MLSSEGFTLIILLFMLAPIVGAVALLFLLFYEKRIDLLKMRTEQAELEREFKQSQYNQLSQQIQPHFMFNTLNVILSLARLRRSEETVRAIEVFSRFLKFKYNTNEPLIPMIEEIQYTEHYIEIQKLRFGSRLSLDFNYDANVKEAAIPPFVLQTLVENAFKHGLERKMGEAVLRIEVKRKPGSVKLSVYDNGSLPTLLPMEEAEMQEYSGHGLDNIMRRFSLCFGQEASVKLRHLKEGGTEVEVVWPYISTVQEKEES